MAPPIWYTSEVPGRSVVVVVAVIAVWLAMFAPQLVGGRVFTSGDARDYRPFAEFSRTRWIERHERTHWNPYVFAGISASASLADARPQYLPDRVLDLYERMTSLPGMPPLLWTLLVHLTGMIAMAHLARALWGAGEAAMVCAGLAWGLTPNLIVPFGFGHDAQFVTASLIPVSLWFVHRLFAVETYRGAWGAAIGLSATLGLSGLAGHPQFLGYTVLLSGAFAIERAWRFNRPGRMVLALSSALVAAAISAAVWWPLILYARDSVRGHGMSSAEVASFSFAVRDFGSLIWPWAVGFGGSTYWGGMRATDYPQYLGLLVALLAVIGLWPRNDGNGRAAGLLGGVALAAMIIALGTRLGPIYDLLYEHVPFWSSVRVVVAGLVVTQVAVALLAARGLERALEASPEGRLARVTLFGLAAVVLVVSLVMLARSADYVAAAMAYKPGLALATARALATHATSDLAWRSVAACVATAALLSRARSARWRVPAQLLVVGLLAADLGLVGVPLMQRCSGFPADLAPSPPTGLARIAAGDTLKRAMAVRREQFFSNEWVGWRTRSVSGLHGATSYAWDMFREAGLFAHPAVLRALAVGYVSDEAHPPRGPGFEPVREPITGETVWRVVGARPRAYPIPLVMAAPNPEAILRALGSEYFDPGAVAFSTDARAAGNYPGAYECSLRWITDDPDHQVLKTTAPASAFLVIADAYAPGWDARMDGHDVPLFRVDHLIRGLKAPAGTHRFELRFLPPGWSLATMVTRIGLATWLLAGLAYLGGALGRLRGASIATGIGRR